jgi:hypothetical protein
MQKKPTLKAETKLTLHRETLRALEPPDLAEVLAGVTSACRSGKTCCNATCNGTC